MHSFIKVLALLGKSACTFVGKCLHSLYIAHNDVMGYFSYNVGLSAIYFQSPSNISFSLITLSLLMNVVAMSMLWFISSLRARCISQ